MVGAPVTSIQATNKSSMRAAYRHQTIWMRRLRLGHFPEGFGVYVAKEAKS